MTRSLRGAAAIAGSASTAYGHLPGNSVNELMAIAAADAMADAGVNKSDIDGLVVASMDQAFYPLIAAEYLGLSDQLKLIEGSNIGGASYVNGLQIAAMAIQSGICECVLIAQGSDLLSAVKDGRGGPAGTSKEGSHESIPYMYEYEPFMPVSAYAMIAARHMHEYGTTREHLAEVAVAARQWAELNPKATRNKPLSKQEVLDAPVFATPFSKYDCCLMTDLGAAVIVTSLEKARTLRRPAVPILGFASGMTHMQVAQSKDITVSAAARTGPLAFEMAGISHADVDMVQLYDCFTINTPLFLEDLGFCSKGEGGDFVSGGRIAPGGEFPVNTNGGGLSCAHPGMYGLMLTLEAVSQIRGEAGERQLASHDIAVCHGNGGHMSSGVTAVLGSENTV